MGLCNVERHERDDASHSIIVFRVTVIFLVIFSALFLLLFQSPYVFNPHRHLLRNILTLGHVPLFGFIASAVLLTLNLKNSKILNWPIWSYIAAALLTVGLSLSTEFIQMLTERDASIKDLLLNNFGAALFLGGGLLWRNRDFLERFGKWQKRLRFIFIVSSAIVLAVILYPLVWLTFDEMEIKISFPIIASFESERELQRWNPGDNELSLSKHWRDEGKQALCVTFHPGKCSGVSLIRPPADWRGFDSLDFTVFNPSSEKLMIILKILDWDHNYNYNDRFNQLLHLSPGRNSISIPLHKIESSPKTRKMRMDRIGQVSMFMRDLTQNKVLCVDNMRLSKDT